MVWDLPERNTGGYLSNQIGEQAMKWFVITNRVKSGNKFGNEPEPNASAPTSTVFNYADIHS